MSPSICLLFLALACGAEEKAEPPAPAPATAPAPAEEPPLPQIPFDGPLLVSEAGMGPVKLCTTVADLRKMVAIGQRVEQVSPWEGDYQAMALSVGEDRLLLIPFPADQELEPSAPITWLVTESARMRTEVGVGPGMPLSFSTTEYGVPKLLYEGDGGPEYVRFSQGPQHLVFRVRPPSGETRGGLYPPGPGPRHETSKFHPAARIDALELRGDCPEPAAATEDVAPTDPAPAADTTEPMPPRPSEAPATP